MKVAIVHDWLNGMRGGEKVLQAMLELYPDAALFTLFHQRGKVSRAIESRRITSSWLDRIPGVYRYYRNMVPLFPSAIMSLDLSGYDLVISSSHSVAKGVRVQGDALHICYCHTPARYFWDAEDDYPTGIFRHATLVLLRPRFQRWDCKASRNVDHFIANSRFVAERIRLYYGREADVIHPPIDTHFFRPSPASQRSDFYLAAGALVPYKRVELVVKAFNSLNRRLIIAGTGPEWTRLRSIAGSNIEFLGWVSDRDLRHLYQSARALVTAAREDFGMVNVEALSCGCPVVAFGAGGSSEIVHDGQNGILFTEQDHNDLIHNIHRFEAMTWLDEAVRHGVENFSREAFKNRIRKSIESRTAQELEATVQPA